MDVLDVAVLICLTISVVNSQGPFGFPRRIPIGAVPIRRPGPFSPMLRPGPFPGLRFGPVRRFPGGPGVGFGRLGPGVGVGLPTGPGMGVGFPTGSGMGVGFPTAGSGMGVGFPTGTGMGVGFPTAGSGMGVGFPTGLGMGVGFPTGSGMGVGFPTGSGITPGAGGRPMGTSCPAERIVPGICAPGRAGCPVGSTCTMDPVRRFGICCRSEGTATSPCSDPMMMGGAERQELRTCGPQAACPACYNCSPMSGPSLDGLGLCCPIMTGACGAARGMGSTGVGFGVTGTDSRPATGTVDGGAGGAGGAAVGHTHSHVHMGHTGPGVDTGSASGTGGGAATGGTGSTPTASSGTGAATGPTGIPDPPQLPDISIDAGRIDRTSLDGTGGSITDTIGRPGGTSTETIGRVIGTAGTGTAPGTGTAGTGTAPGTGTAVELCPGRYPPLGRCNRFTNCRMSMECVERTPEYGICCPPVPTPPFRPTSIATSTGSPACPPRRMLECETRGGDQCRDVFDCLTPSVCCRPFPFCRTQCVMPRV